MSGWTLYWILIADNIREVMWTITIPCIVLSAIAIIAILASVASESLSDGERKDCRKFGGKLLKPIAPLLAFFFLALAATPNTKQAAVIVIIPAIANNEAIQSEAKDIYDLAKQWMREQVKSEVPSESP